jgi:hypothetical protein
MQFAKDSFYIALRERLAALNPARVVTIQGEPRPALIVSENEAVTSSAAFADAFYIDWGKMHVVKEHSQGGRPLMGVDCAIRYFSAGTCTSAVDRGRTLAALDMELLSICHPANTRKCDYTQSPSVDLGSGIFWTAPDIEHLETGRVVDSGADEPANSLVRHRAQLTVYFFPEADLP